MSLAPRAHVRVIYEGVDITHDVSGDLLSCTFTDNEGGSADDISLRLKNNHAKWTHGWAPQEGDVMQVTIITERDSGVKELECGAFTIDEISVSGPPSTIEIKGASLPIDTTIRRKKKSRAWESVTLAEIAADMAANGGLELVYLPLETREYDRRDQHDETDLQFLARLCADENYQLKCTDRQLVVYSVEELEADPTIKLITVGQDNVIAWSFDHQAHDVYKTATVKYTDPETGLLNEYTYASPDIIRGGELSITKRASSIAEAEQFAKSEIYRRNRREVTGKLSLMGETDLLAGLNVDVRGLGVYNGKYFINKAEHSVGSGYTATLELNRVEEA